VRRVWQSAAWMDTALRPVKSAMAMALSAGTPSVVQWGLRKLVAQLSPAPLPRNSAAMLINCQGLILSHIASRSASGYVPAHIISRVR
jgi:hypothetical protein